MPADDELDIFGRAQGVEDRVYLGTWDAEDMGDALPPQAFHHQVSTSHPPPPSAVLRIGAIMPQQTGLRNNAVARRSAKATRI